MSDGKLKRGSVYSLLGRLEKDGMVKAVEEPPTNEHALPRTRYKITAAGVASLHTFASFVNLPRDMVGGAA